MPTSEAVLIELYKKMLLIRLAEKKIVEVYPTDKIQSPVHLSFGQEGISAGVGLAMKRTDHLYGTYRNHGIYMAKGGDLKKMFAELYGKDTGCARGKGGSMHLVLTVLRQLRLPIVANDVSLAFHVLQSARTVSEDPCDAILVLVSVSHDLSHGSRAEVHRYEIRLARRQEGQAVNA
jgi:hypothetical protein